MQDSFPHSPAVAMARRGLAFMISAYVRCTVYRRMLHCILMVSAIATLFWPLISHWCHFWSVRKWLSPQHHLLFVSNETIEETWDLVIWGNHSMHSATSSPKHQQKMRKLHPFATSNLTYMDVSENSGTPKSSILIGFSIIFTIHFGVPLFPPICILPKMSLKTRFLQVPGKLWRLNVDNWVSQINQPNLYQYHLQNDHRWLPETWTADMDMPYWIYRDIWNQKKIIGVLVANFCGVCFCCLVRFASVVLVFVCLLVRLHHHHQQYHHHHPHPSSLSSSSTTTTNNKIILHQDPTAMRTHWAYNHFY